ncbi:hypothetical protein CHISP_0395 [Chitinispirillum alkaliphilum]|nr:hypothetical protein CHISP_0395 [Chitinispirillum alkaliphilum]
MFPEHLAESVFHTILVEEPSIGGWGFLWKANYPCSFRHKRPAPNRCRTYKRHDNWD